MSSVLHCYTITKQLKEAIAQVSEENRDVTIEQIDSLLEKRQGVLGAINHPFSEEEQSLGKQMMTWNKEIDKKLITIRADIKRDMNGLNKKKTSAQKYTNPYESMQYDGMFYDKRNRCDSFEKATRGKQYELVTQFAGMLDTIEEPLGFVEASLT